MLRSTSICPPFVGCPYPRWTESLAANRGFNPGDMPFRRRAGPYPTANGTILDFRIFVSRVINGTR